MREHYDLLLNKEYFKFSCAHFLIFPDGSKERLHGHNYHVQVWIEAGLSESGLVLDFIQVKPVVKALCDKLDEHYLLPVEHPEIRYQERDGHLFWQYRDYHYQAPRSEVILMPINNSSVENLARWFARELMAHLQARFLDLQMQRLTVSVSETRGQSGSCTLLLEEK
jgi:6-pyruvoyltetrahydropterin/6-carboxytetrahydropterin synthase